MIAVAINPLSTPFRRTFLAVFRVSTDKPSAVHAGFHTHVDDENRLFSAPYYTVHGVHTNILNRGKMDKNRVYRKRRGHSWTPVDRGQS